MCLPTRAVCTTELGTTAIGSSNEESPEEVTMRTIENDIPEELVELARDAMELGLYSVNLGFQYLDSDFVSPIEWALSLHKIEPDNRATERSWLSVTAARGDDGPTAYIPSEDRSNWREGVYWNTDQVREWLTQPIEGDLDDEYSQSWEPAATPDAREYFLRQWPLFLEGVRSGWTMERKVRWRDHLSFGKIWAEHGLPADRFPNASLEWSITNSFYNAEGHPDHRDTGAPISVGGWSLLTPDKPEEFHRRSIRLERLSPKDARQEISSTAPWFVRVALNDEENEQWLHYPEALQDPEDTVQEAPSEKQ